MGGLSKNNSLGDMYKNYPLVERVFGLPEYFLASAGYHVWSTYLHQVSEHRNDYVEMNLHHFLTLSLIFGGHIMGDIDSGLLTIYITNFTNIWVHFAKATMDIGMKKLCDLCGVLLFFFWFYFRLVCFPWCIWQMLFVHPFEIPGMEGSYEGDLYKFKGCLVGLLVLMGVWWWYLIYKMVYKSIMKGKLEDIHNKVD